MMYQLYEATDVDGVDWYANDNRQATLPIPARPLLAPGKKGK